MMNLNEFAKEVHANAVAHGWWDGERSEAEIVAFLHRETSLAYDGREMFPVFLGIAVNAAFVWLRACGIDPEALMLEKHAYNKTRPAGGLGNQRIQPGSSFLPELRDIPSGSSSSGRENASMKINGKEFENMKMREILFRGKSIDAGEWLWGDLTRTINSDYYDQIWVCDEYGGSDNYLVKRDTICEYTGLLDKNGKKIFEGDIISTSMYGIDDGTGHNSPEKDYFIVRFEDGKFCIENSLRKFIIHDVVMEVIGNIYDNPELLEAKKNYD